MRKKIKRIAASILSGVMILSSCVLLPTDEVKAEEQVSHTFDVSKYNLVWDSPSIKEVDSMPVGNGNIGANVWMENGTDLVFYMSRIGAYNQNCATIKLGRIRVTFSNAPFEDGKKFLQTLDLQNGCIDINAGEDVSIKMWMDAYRDVIHVEGTTTQSQDITVTYELDWGGRTLTDVTDLPENYGATDDIIYNNGEDRIIWYHRNSSSYWAQLAAQNGVTENMDKDPALNLTFGGDISGSGMTKEGTRSLKASDTNAFDIKAHIYSDICDSPREWFDGLSSQIEQDDKVSKEEAYTEHQNWWKEYWEHSYVEITGGPENAYELTQNYLLERFMLGIALRGEDFIPFHGSIYNVNVNPINKDPNKNGSNLGYIYSADQRLWEDLVIMWQNTRAPYWSLMQAGDSEQMGLFVDHVYDLVPVRLEETKKRFGFNDALFLPEPMYPSGVGHPAQYASHLEEHFTATAEIPLMMVQYYKFFGDEERMQDKILPFTELCVNFFNKMYPQNDDNGKMILYPAAAVEQGINCTNPTAIVAPLTALLEDLVNNCPETLSESQKKLFSDTLNRMPDIATAETNGVEMYALAENYESIGNQCETSELYGVWPSALFMIGEDTEPDELQKARQTFLARTWNLFNTHSEAMITGGWNMSTIQSTKLGLREESAKLINMVLTDNVPDWDCAGLGTYSTIPARFPGFFGPYYDSLPDQCHGGNAANALQQMVLQYKNDKIYLLPSLPEDWDVNFRLYAPENTAVTATYKDGQLAYELDSQNPDRENDVVNMMAEKNVIVNRVSVACGDENYKFGKESMADGKYDENNLEKYPISKEWLSEYGESVNGTTAGQYGWNQWGGDTYNKKTHTEYLHLTDWNGNITLPTLRAEIESAEAMNGKPVEVVNNEQGLKITMAASDIDETDTVIKLKLNAESADKPDIMTVPEFETIEVNLGKNAEELELPAEAKVVLNDIGLTEKVLEIIWDTEAYDGNTPGTYKLKGTFKLPEDGSVTNSKNLQPEITVTVLSRGNYETEGMTAVGATNIVYGWIPGHLTDGDVASGWHTEDGVTDAWVTIDLKGSLKISTFSALPRKDDNGNGVGSYSGRFIKDFDLYISDTAPVYKDYQEKDGTYEIENPDQIQGQVGSFTFDRPSALEFSTVSFEEAEGRYLTVHIKNVQDGVGSCINVMELGVGYEWKEPPADPVNKDALAEAASEAGKVLSDKESSRKYEKAALDSLKEALESANAILEDDTVSQDTVDEAAETLKAAVTGVHESEKNWDAYETALKEGAAVLKDIEAGKYEDESAQAYVAAYNAVKDLSDEATQTSINEAVDALQKAKDALRPIDGSSEEGEGDKESGDGKPSDQNTSSSSTDHSQNNTSGIAQTGDSSNPIGWILLAAITVLMSIGVLRLKSFKK